MKGKRILGISGLLVLMILTALVAVKLGSADTGIPDTKDAKEIQAVIQKSYDLEVKAARDFDTSEFSSVFVNDARVPLDKSTKEFVKKVKIKKGETLKDDYGFLDYKKAYFELWQTGAVESEAIQEKAKKENRDLTSDEKKAMAENMHRSTGPDKKVSLIFHSIKIDGDMATAIFDDGPRVNEFHLVKINNQWSIAGWIILEVHA